MEKITERYHFTFGITDFEETPKFISIESLPFVRSSLKDKQQIISEKSVHGYKFLKDKSHSCDSHKMARTKNKGKQKQIPKYLLDLNLRDNDKCKRVENSSEGKITKFINVLFKRKENAQNKQRKVNKQSSSLLSSQNETQYDDQHLKTQRFIKNDQAKGFGKLRKVFSLEILDQTHLRNSPKKETVQVKDRMMRIPLRPKNLEINALVDLQKKSFNYQNMSKNRRHLEPKYIQKNRLCKVKERLQNIKLMQKL